MEDLRCFEAQLGSFKINDFLLIFAAPSEWYAGAGLHWLPEPTVKFSEILQADC